MIVFTPGTVNEWGAEMAMAMTYLEFEARGVEGAVLDKFRLSFNARTAGLVQLGRLLGSPVKMMGIDPCGEGEDGETRRRGDGESGAGETESFFGEAPLAAGRDGDETRVVKSEVAGSKKGGEA